MNEKIPILLVLILVVLLFLLAACSVSNRQSKSANLPLDPVEDQIVDSLDYDAAFYLDAENLAELGIKEAYDDLRPTLHKYISDSYEIIEHFDNSSGRYWVQAEDQTFEIFESASSDVGNAWGLATVALFSIINKQLLDEDIRFYALYGGNDLYGIFLTEQQALEARRFHKDKKNWPYLPVSQYPWFGQPH